MENVKKGEITENLNISEAGSEGNALARIDNFVVFAEGAVPGDVAALRIQSRHQSQHRSRRQHRWRQSDLLQTETRD